MNDGCHSLSCGADSQIVVENVEGELQVGRGGGAHFQVFVSTSAADYCAALSPRLFREDRTEQCGSSAHVSRIGWFFARVAVKAWFRSRTKTTPSVLDSVLPMEELLDPPEIVSQVRSPLP